MLKAAGLVTVFGDAQRTNYWSDPGPQGTIGVEGDVSVGGTLVEGNVIFAGRMAFGGNGASLDAWDASTGDIVWSLFRAESSVSAPVLSDGLLYCAFFDGMVVALDAATGRQRWEARALPNNAVGAHASVLFDSGILYVAVGAYASAFDATTGARLWATHLVLDANDASGSHDAFLLLLSGGALIVACTGDSLATFALNPSAGAINWSLGNDDVVLAGSDRLYAPSSTGWSTVDLLTGAVMHGGVATPQRPARSPHANTIYCPTWPDSDGAQYLQSWAANANGDFEQGWNVPLPQDLGLAVGPTAFVGDLVVLTQASGVSTYDAMTGQAAWQVSMPCTDLRSFLGASDGRIYIGTKEGWIVLGGDDGPNKTAIHQINVPPIAPGIAVVLNKDATMYDAPSSSAFPVASYAAGMHVAVTGPSVSAEGKTWWPVADGAVAVGYLPEDVLTVTGCPPN